MRRSVVLAIQGLLTVVLLVLVFQNFDWQAFRDLFARLPLSFYCASLAVVFSGLVLYAWRWRVILQSLGVHVPFSQVLKQYFVGVFLNNFFPSTIGGDAAKVLYLGRRHGYRLVTASVLLDRLLGLGILASLATAALWIQPVAHPRYLAARLVLSSITLGFGLALAITLVGVGGLPSYLTPVGRRAVDLATRLQRFRVEVAGALTSPRTWIHSCATVGIYFVLVTLVYQAFTGLLGDRSPDFLAVLMVAASTAVLSNVPITINGLGLREQLHVLLLEPLGVPPEVSVALSLLIFGHLLVASLAGGALWWRTPALQPPPEPGAADSTASRQTRSL